MSAALFALILHCVCLAGNRQGLTTLAKDQELVYLEQVIVPQLGQQKGMTSTQSS